MKESKKAILDLLKKDSKGGKFESLVLNLALQKMQSENYEFDGHAVYTVDRKRLVYYVENKGQFRVPEGVEVLGQMSLANKSGLKQLILPQSLKVIEKNAVADCDALERVRIPASVEEIEAYAFVDCDGLKKVVLDGTETKVSRKAFDDCDMLREINVPDESVKAVRKMLHLGDDPDFLVVGRNDQTRTQKETDSLPPAPSSERGSDNQ